MRQKLAERDAGITANLSTQKTRAKSTYKKGQGIIYIIGALDGSTPYKIGFTSRKDTSKRLNEIQAGTWTELELLYESPIQDNITQIEKRVHSHYGMKRIKNEWFALTKKELHKLKDQLKEGYFTDEKFLMKLILGI